MTVTRRLARLVTATFAIVLASTLAPVSANAAGDVTPPTGSMEYWTINNATQRAELRFAYSDPESGLDHIEFMCDGGPEYLVPYAAKVFLPIHDGSAGCSTAYGNHEVLAWVVNGDGLKSNQQYAAVTNGPTLSLEISAAPTTGHAVTLAPVLPSDYTIPPGSACSWELRWGTTEALDQTFSGETFGGMYFVQPASEGGCGPWTFTLPWVPVRQFDVIVLLGTPDPGPDIAFGARAHRRFTAAVDSTDRRIYNSNLPIAQVLPNTYAPIVGQPITYTRYLIGGATNCCNPNWSARLGDGDHALGWSQAGGATFTITPPVTGDVLVQWNASGSNNRFLNAYYDPAVRTRDRTAPVTTAPHERIRPMAMGDTIPIGLDWRGSDRGWGIASYQLQKSVNGGTWTSVSLGNPAAKATGVTGLPGSTMRFRVRAKDRAGNLGAWASGPTFRVTRVADGNASVRYSSGWSSRADGAAFGASVHSTSAVGKAMSYTFSGRDLGWIASRGPDHGRAKVYIDGTYVGSVDLFAASPEARRIVFVRHWASAGTHRVRIVNVATSGRPVIDVDGFAILR